MTETRPSLSLNTEGEILSVLAKATESVIEGILTREQAESIASLASCALLAIRQQHPEKYWWWQPYNPQYLYGPYGSTVKTVGG